MSLLHPALNNEEGWECNQALPSPLGDSCNRGRAKSGCSAQLRVQRNGEPWGFALVPALGRDKGIREAPAHP